MAPARKVTGPSNFCEWVIGTTIPSALGPIPRNKKPRCRDVVRVEITTDDESEEDTLKITYPRTGRSKQTFHNPGPAIKKVRFDENTKDAPRKSALKKQKASTADSDDTSDSAADPTTDSEADSSDDVPKPVKGKKQHHKSKSSSDADSEYDSDPHPTCKCPSCAKGRGILRKLGKKGGKGDSDSNTETSESEADNPSVKGKKKSGGNGKKSGGKKTNESSSEGETSDTSKDTPESEPEKAPKTKVQAKKTAVKTKEEPKSEESETNAETSESEPDPPPKVKKQDAAKPKGGKQTESSDADGETSESGKDTGEEAKPAKKNNPNKNKPDSGKKNDQPQQKQKQKEKQKQTKKQPQKQKKKPESETSDQDEDKEEENTSKKEKTKSKKAKQVEETEKATSKKSKNKDGAKKGNYPEAMPHPNPRRPNLIEPIRAEVVQTERVVETPEDPAPNAYYDQEHNIVRVYYGPVYGNHHGSALYPSRTGNNQPLPMGIPHPTQNPYYYGFNNQQPPHQPLQPPQGYGYSHVPITQGMPPGAWNAVAPPPGFPPGQQPVAQLDGQQMKGDGGMYVMSGGAGFPPSSKDKDKDGLNNIGPEDFKEKTNPYIPKRAKSQFSSYVRHPSKETRHSGNDSAHQVSNQGWSNQDGAGDQQSKWGGSDRKNEWNQTSHSQQGQHEWGSSGRYSQRSNDSAKRRQGDHWGSDTWPKADYSSKDWNTDGQNGHGSNSNAVGWGQDRPGDSTANSNPPNNVMPGTWVESTAPTPAWGDLSAAVDTQGKFGEEEPRW